MKSITCMWRIISLVGLLSQVNHYGLYQGWKWSSIHLLVILRTSHNFCFKKKFKYFTKKITTVKTVTQTLLHVQHISYFIEIPLFQTITACISISKQGTASCQYLFCVYCCVLLTTGEILGGLSNHYTAEDSITRFGTEALRTGVLEWTDKAADLLNEEPHSLQPRGVFFPRVNFTVTFQNTQLGKRGTTFFTKKRPFSRMNPQVCL